MCERGYSSNLWQEETLAGLLPSVLLPTQSNPCPSEDTAQKPRALGYNLSSE